MRYVYDLRAWLWVCGYSIPPKAVKEAAIRALDKAMKGFCASRPEDAPAQVKKILKKRPARKLFLRLPEINRFFRSPHAKERTESVLLVIVNLLSGFPNPNYEDSFVVDYFITLLGLEQLLTLRLGRSRPMLPVGRLEQIFNELSRKHVFDARKIKDEVASVSDETLTEFRPVFQKVLKLPSQIRPLRKVFGEQSAISTISVMLDTIPHYMALAVALTLHLYILTPRFQDGSFARISAAERDQQGEKARA